MAYTHLYYVWSLVNHHYSTPVTSGVPQESILGPLLFFIYANDMPDRLSGESKLALFDDDSKLFRSMSSRSSSATLHSLFQWSEDWQMSFNILKFQVLHMLRKRAPNHTHTNCHLRGQDQQLGNLPPLCKNIVRGWAQNVISILFAKYRLVSEVLGI